MARADTGNSDSERREIRLVEEEDGRWSAIDEGAGVASQGETRSEALANLDEAVALHRGEIGDPITDADLRDLGIDPDTVPDEPQVPDAPWFSE
ncbi:HicB family component of toxin-antitoxin system,antitoxin, predicted inactivated nuclease of the RNAse Hfold [Halapricum desulfuricans]|uniref:HicB family component of toxin-antitoxin system,antitoxin, predicted inactivated nuclease of the RNAse Hfold n=1 Tax=Halapricum desulfuricans TaxID=2841257 RepID=A0A897NM73_9EURY|nr:type II toxin-antitoxin system HicB family antitoxin [Halapricum desulfuricans]QSG13371.1 HicB family component of toxin-antitoxin system,antitoxin, predicted inactivated nuclease of the RNAse Hfold [Halapricum desulfuricans]